MNAKWDVQKASEVAPDRDLDVKAHMQEGFGIDMDMLDTTAQQVLSDFINYDASFAVMQLIRQAQLEQNSDIETIGEEA